MWKIRKDHIKLPEIIILDHFLLRYNVVLSTIHEFLQLAQSTLRNQGSNFSTLLVTGCRKSFFENIFLTGKFIVTVYHLSYICCKKHLH